MSFVFSPNLCVTHFCNLDCVYCYQTHDRNNRMSFEVAKQCIDWIFTHVPEDAGSIEISFIGGEPLLEFNLLKNVYEYTRCQYPNPPRPTVFYATTNGTLLNEEMEHWFWEHRDSFVLGLSLDGLPDTHNHNRCNSYEKIDINFFLRAWPNQGVKMTLSEFSLNRLADNVIHIHDLGFKEVGGVNLFEGTFDWGDEKFIRMIIPQLRKLVDFYVEHDDLRVDQMLGRRIDLCEAKKSNRKWCGIGTGAVFFDTDGVMYPCPFVTPMTFGKDDLTNILSMDFTDDAAFIDDQCFSSCYLYPICPICAGANYLNEKSFKKRDKTKCRIQKLIAIYCAELCGRRIVKNPSSFDPNRIFRTVSAVKKIKELFLPEFSDYWDIM